jgi:2-C-methyl-D-erythritol 2,4-cyclodiphosphate synthase
MNKLAEYRVGTGYDIHRLEAGRRLVLGGVEIPFDRGLLGHSDADAVIHAICDALLGASALGDIGRHFPDTDPAFAGASSLRLLEAVRDMLAKESYQIGNIDVTVHAERPKLGSFIASMRERLAATLGIDTGAINIKAKTNEGLDAVGRGEAIAATAIAIVFRS